MDEALLIAGNWRAKYLWRRYYWTVALLVPLLAVIASPWILGPKCPRHLVLASASKDGVYHRVALDYQELLAREGVTLEIRNTKGSVENLELLGKPDSPIDLALVQGGIAGPADREKFQSLGSLFIEPIWVFCRGTQPPERLSELEGKRLAIGPPGSGVRAVAQQLLEENGISIRGENVPVYDDTLGGYDAAAALRRGDIDVAFFVLAPESPLVRDLLRDPQLSLMSFRRAAAYMQRLPYLTSVTLGEGMVDLEENIPRRDIVLLAPTASLVAHKDLHPALVPLLLAAAGRVHESGGLLHPAGKFPSPQYVDCPLSENARRWYKAGPTLLYRVFPFQVAAWLDRAKVMLLPLMTILLPLAKGAPPLYRWRIRSKIYRWYRVLREIDQKMKSPEERYDPAGDIERLHRLEHELSEVSVPLSYMEEFYNLRLHVSFVRGRLERMLQADVLPLRRAA